jgi:acetyl esterase/lipase
MSDKPIGSRSKKYPYAIILLVLVVVCSVGIVLSQQSDGALKNVQYLPDGSPGHQLDLYLPDKASFDSKRGAPLIVWIHGGGWIGGDKADNPALAARHLGYAVASLNYRLAKDKDSIFPAQIEDCKTAIRWLRKHASEYGIDDKRIGVWGASAGGHLVLLLGLTGDDQFKTADYPEYSSKVEAVCDWCGPTDLLTISEQNGAADNLATRNERGPLARLLGGKVEERKELAKSASPVTYVRAECPPILIVHGAQDHTVSPLQSDEILKDLQAVHADVQLLSLPQAGHNVNSPEAMAKTKEFFESHLKALP